MERWQAKVLATLITVVLMLIAVFIPFKIVASFKKLGSKGNRILVTLNCFTGGIFLGTTLFFLVPEVILLMRQPEDSGFLATYPLAEAIMGLGFVAIMFLERFVHSCRKTKKAPLANGTKNFGPTENTKLRSNNNDCLHYSVASTEVKVEECDTVEGTCIEDEDQEVEESLVNENATKAVILFIALSMDEFLGGISLGLQRTTTAVWGILIGLLAHECVVGFSFGLQLASISKSRPGCMAYALGLSYSLIGPAGAVVGTLIGELWSEDTDTNFVNGCLQGLATGVFLYVTFFEILEGKMHSKSRYMDLVAVTIGIIIMGLIAAIPKQQEPDDATTNITTTAAVTTITQRLS